MFTHKFEKQYETVLGEKKMKDIEKEIYESIRHLLPDLESMKPTEDGPTKITDL